MVEKPEHDKAGKAKHRKLSSSLDYNNGDAIEYIGNDINNDKTNREKHDRKRRHKSEQSKLLVRRLTFKLFRDIAIYTAAFIALAIFLNATFVPRLANWVADNTSAWQRVEYGSIPVKDTLEMLDAEVYFIAYDPSGLSAISNESIVEGILSSSSVSYDDLLTDEAAGVMPDAEMVSSIMSGSMYGAAASGGSFAVDEKGSGQQTLSDSSQDAELADDQLFEEYAAVLTEAASGDAIIEAWGLTPIPYSQVQADIDNPNAVLLLCKIDDKPATWYKVIALQELATMDLISQEEYGTSVQVMQKDESGVAIRELSTYASIRELKFPVAIAIYLFGLLIVVLLGYGRALKYYDDLVSAVASLVGNREKPIVLPPVLSATQSELNGIRLASLADERAAQAAERRKDELVAYLAHDVKTPLTSVIGYLTLLDEAPDMPEESRRRYIQTAFQKSERLEELIDEFFEITRYNLQAIPIERTHVDARLFCEQVAEEFFPEASSRGLRLSVDMDQKDDGLIFVDPDKLARALGNVIRNAVAYADANTEVKVSMAKVLQQLGQGDRSVSKRDAVMGGCWVIEVENQGREISKAHLESIFDKFYREEKSRTSTSGRAGLGLAIAKEIVLAHGGEISAESENGRTVFTIVLPM